jgi:SAM-dependent methyltransferase
MTKVSQRTNDHLQELYRSADSVRTTGLNRSQAEAHYAPYLNFVRRYHPSGKLLDVGCGVGWSTAVFAAHGFDATGIDLNGEAFEPPPQQGLSLQAGSALDIPFPDKSFDVVGSYQVIEHVPDPEKMLDEMLRVVKPGGTVCVVGPNLLGLNGSITGLTKHVWQSGPVTSILFRKPDTPRHPFGNTLPELLYKLLHNLTVIGGKQLTSKATFTMREPDLTPPFHADNDATYLCNPIDLVRHFRSRGCQVLQDVAPGRSRVTRMLAAGTWVAVRKAGKQAS